MDPVATERTRSLQVKGALRTAASLSFGLFLILLLGANSVVGYGGPLDWLPLVRLPSATGEWALVGPVLLLPLLSMAAWVAARLVAPSARPLSFGWRRINLPMTLLGALALGSLALQCVAGDCRAGIALRGAILLALFAWVYCFTLNEQPDLILIIAPIVLLQSVVAAGQFVVQRDFGLRFLGELPLDPVQSGISVVMNDGARWLRGYGLTVHPNAAGRTVATCLLMLAVLWPTMKGWRRPLLLMTALVGLAGMMATLSRWSAVCLLLGVLMAAQPAIPRLRSRPAVYSRAKVIAAVTAVAVVGVMAGTLLLNAYGGTLSGRLTEGSSSLEERSIRERERDMRIAVELLSASPLTGVGFGRYEAAATSIDPWAMVVHNVPLYLAAELGLLGAAAWLLLVFLPLVPPDGLLRSLDLAGLWLGFWLLGLFYALPHPLIETRSALLAGLVAGLVTLRRGLVRQQ